MPESTKIKIQDKPSPIFFFFFFFFYGDDDDVKPSFGSLLSELVKNNNTFT